MTRTLVGADVRGFYSALGIHLSTWAHSDATVRCFAQPEAHRREDRHPSCSVSLVHGAWRCHGCGARGGAFDAAVSVGHSDRSAIDLMVRHGLIERRDPRPGSAPRRTAVLGSGHASHVPSRTPQLGVTRHDIARWQSHLEARPALIGRLAAERGWRYATMRELRLGLQGNAITIPVSDERGTLVGVQRYQPWPAGIDPKMRAVAGSVRQLLPHPAAEPARRLLLVEGEPDMIAARSRGLTAIAIPGVDCWRAEWAPWFVGRTVTIVPDADRAGRALASAVADDLRALADVHVVDIAAHRDDGYDLTDWLLDHPSSTLQELR
jgi:hypothetical protein